MKFSSLGLLASFITSLLAEDLLFVDTFEFREFSEATTVLGYTTKVVTEAQWMTMSTSDFAAFKAIIIADPDCSTNPADVQFLVDSKAAWGPAVQGNIILIGTDPTLHFASVAGAKDLIDNSIKFAASGVSTTGVTQTGLYFALSCYYNNVGTSTAVDSLSYFGDFTARGQLGCFNKAHIVASSPALGTLNDAALSDWSCSVHEVFSNYPSVGINGFQALAIAQDVIGDGSQTFGDGTVGLPYILSRGATPAGCGDGIWQTSIGEECDDGNVLNGDGCSASCKCESGRPAGDGTCLPPLAVSSVFITETLTIHDTATVVDISTIHDTATIFNTKTIHDTATVIATVHDTKTIHDVSVTTTTIRKRPYVTPAVPSKGRIIGIEIIIHISIIETHTTSRHKTVTSYITKERSIENRPIWSTSKAGYPCYACVLSSAGTPWRRGHFITATTTSLAPTNMPKAYKYKPIPPTILPCDKCLPYKPSTCPAYSTLPPSKIFMVPAPTFGTHAQHADRIPEKAMYVPAGAKATVVTSRPAGARFPTAFVTWIELPAPTPHGKGSKDHGRAWYINRWFHGV